MNEELNKSMYYGASAITFQKAFQLRTKMTPEESLLWEKLKGKQILNVRFRRQHPIAEFIVDFYCHTTKLIIEIDGKIHLQQKEYDNKRTAIFEKNGLKLIRFSNDEINSHLENVIQEIIQVTKFQLL